MNAQLLCRARPGSTLTFTLAGDESVLGREPGLGVALPLEGVSRRHARVTWDGRFHWIEDLDSTNGTFLNGRPVRRERLRHLDVITLGKKADLIFVLRGDEFRQQRTQGIVRAALRVEGGDGETHEVPTGEVTLGRSSACNIVLESAAVSKVHARVERRLAQLVIEDLGSSNGTFVNGVRTSTTLLHDGDVVLLGGVMRLRVTIELGEVSALSGSRTRADWLPSRTTTSQSRPQFGSEWRTRFEWGSSELRELDVPGAGAPREADAARKRATAPVPPSARAAAAPPPPRPVARAATAPQPVVRPAPEQQAKPAAAAPPPPSQPLASAPSPVAPSAPPSVAASAAPSAAPPVAAPVAPPPVSARLPPESAPAPIAELYLRGGAFALSVTEPGAHQLGRASESALRVDHPTVSRRHARLILSEDRSTAYVQDLGGANGTWLNGTAIAQLAPLREGDCIRVGEVDLTVSFRRG